MLLYFVVYAVFCKFGIVGNYTLLLVKVFCIKSWWCKNNDIFQVCVTVVACVHIYPSSHLVSCRQEGEKDVSHWLHFTSAGGKKCGKHTASSCAGQQVNATDEVFSHSSPTATELKFTYCSKLFVLFNNF